MSIILGIDPGSKYTGVGIIKKEGSDFTYIHSEVFALPVKASFSQKLYTLSQELDRIYRQFPISATSVEKIFYGKNVDSAFKLGHIRGVCLCTSARHGVQVFEYAAKYAKKVVTGSGSSSKESVQNFVNQLLKVNITKLDESDALALSLCHGFSDREQRGIDLSGLRI